MDGVHDLGGQQNHGRIAVRDDDAPFHHDWEWRMWAIARAFARPSDWNIDKFRFTRELLQPAEYLERSYFDQWYTAYAAMLLGSGLATAEELSTGKSTERAPASLKPMSVADVAKLAMSRCASTGLIAASRALASGSGCARRFPDRSATRGLPRIRARPRRHCSKPSRRSCRSRRERGGEGGRRAALYRDLHARRSLPRAVRLRRQGLARPVGALS